MQTATEEKKTRTRKIKVASTGFHFVLKWDEKSINENRRKLRHARAIQELTMQQVADRSGLSIRTVWNFEDVEDTRQIAPRLKTWLVIIQALGGTVSVTAPDLH